MFGAGLAGRPASDVIRHPDFHDALGLALGPAGRGLARLQLAAPGAKGLYDVHITRQGSGPLRLVYFIDRTELDQADAIRRDFVANVSHELRTPLTALVGFIETLRGAARNDPEARERFLTIMEREAGRMIRLVNDLLSLSRVEAEEHRRPSQTVDLLPVLRSVLLTERDRAGAAGVEMSLAPGGAPSLVVGDADQLTQVFLNLAENAIKYGAAGGRVLFRIEEIPREPKLRARALAVTVEDFGEGIDPLHLPRLTERFYRVDSHRSREKGGTGLGLAIVK
ncbi:MAG: two-component sensor histidine kinase, partial [Proteobacteria bacterium]|nr:two-component sensor histidine kinase [Pseudomonadota bacterium]